MGNKRNYKSRKLKTRAYRKMLQEKTSVINNNRRNMKSTFITLAPLKTSTGGNTLAAPETSTGGNTLAAPETSTGENTQCIEEIDDIEDYPLNIEVAGEDGFQPVSGRRIIDINYVMSQLQEKSHHIDLFDCKMGYFELVGERRTGLISKFKFQCKVCKNNVIIDSEEPDNKENVNVNVAATTGIVATGVGYAQFEELFSAMDIPVFSKKYFTRLQDVVYENWEKTAAESMKTAAMREKEAAIAEGRVKDGIPLVDVSIDGAWGLRSYGNNYRSASGTAAIIGTKFGEVLYMGVKNKYCMICAQAEKKVIDPKPHQCFKNYSGPSGAMEAELISEGFKASLEMYGIIYARMVADGDASTYDKILKADPYKTHNFTVEKIECRNHVLRNFCNKLRAVTKDTKYSIAHRKTLTNERIMSMRKVIVKSVKHHKNSDIPKQIAISLLHKDISNSVAHAYGDHRLCNDYNCSKDKNLINSLFQNVQNSTFLFRVNAIVSTAAAKARSLIEDVDTNSVERLNSVIAKFVGGKRINFALRRGYQGRCSAAVVSYNNETAISSVQKAILGKSPKGKVKEMEKRRALKRKLNREHPVKKIRKFNEKQADTNVQHDYGPNSSAPDMDPEQLEKATENFLRNLRTLTADKNRIERNTILQRDSSEWMEIRKNIITASNFGSICKRQKSRNTAPLVKNILYKKSLANILSVSHGIENEKHALQQLETQENITIQPCGLFIDQKYPFIGATPDGLVGDDYLVEVKCPLTAFKQGIDAAIKGNKIQIYKYNKKTMSREINKKSHWFYQIQGQLHVTGRSTCIFGIWYGENHPMLVENIKRDDEFWKKNMEQNIVNFYMKCLLPEIIDAREIRGMPLRHITLQDDQVSDVSKTESKTNEKENQPLMQNQVLSKTYDFEEF